MRRILFTSVAVFSMMLAMPQVSLARIGARPSVFMLQAVPGGPVAGRFRLAEHLNKKPIVILFWATWCRPCQQELPFYQSLYQQYKEQGLTIVAVSMDDSTTLPQAGPTARRLGLTFPVVSDLDTRVTSQLNPRRAAPFSIWIDKSGQIVREHEGFTLAEREEIRTGITALVTGNGAAAAAPARAPAPVAPTAPTSAPAPAVPAAPTRAPSTTTPAR